MRRAWDGRAGWWEYLRQPPVPDVLTAAGVALVVGVLFVLLTLDRGKTWSFAIIGVAAHASLGFVYGNGGGAIRIVGIVPALGIFLAAGSVAHGFYGGMPYSKSPFVFWGAPVAIAAVAAHLAGGIGQVRAQRSGPFLPPQVVPAVIACGQIQHGPREPSSP